jgi:hypothetical protein
MMIWEGHNRHYPTETVKSKNASVKRGALTTKKSDWDLSNTKEDC